MRIAHIISAAGAGGAELLVKDLSNEMKARGHDVVIIFLDEAKSVLRDENFEKKFLFDLDSKGIEYYFLGTACRRNPILGVFRLRKILSKFKPDIVHSHLYYGTVFSVFSLTTILRRVKLVYTHHNIILGAPSLIYSLMNLKVHGYVGICQACSDLILSLTSKPVRKIYNAVDVDKFEIKPIREDFVNFILIGRLTEQKNIRLLIEAVSLIRRDNFHVSIAGEGPEKELLMENVKSLGVSNKVSFLGNVSDIAKVLGDYDVFLLTSKWEGLPISQIESSVSGKPVIVTNVGGCAELVSDLKNGLVVNDIVPQSYSDAMKKMIDDKQFRFKCHENASKYSHKYSIKNSVDKHLEFYQELI
ncbi:glycosyltransferase [Vibrio cyclitrophicus]